MNHFLLRIFILIFFFINYDFNGIFDEKILIFILKQLLQLLANNEKIFAHLSTLEAVIKRKSRIISQNDIKN